HPAIPHAKTLVLAVPTPSSLIMTLPTTRRARLSRLSGAMMSRRDETEHRHPQAESGSKRKCQRGVKEEAPASSSELEVFRSRRGGISMPCLLLLQRPPFRCLLSLTLLPPH